MVAVVSQVRIPAEPFPFMRHRTLAQVARTEALVAKLATGDPIPQIDRHELSLLLAKAKRHNPPPTPDKAGAA